MCLLIDRDDIANDNLEEDVTDAPITEEIDKPEEEEAYPDYVIDERMLRWELAPVLVNNLQGLLINSIKVRGSCYHQINLERKSFTLP